MSVHKEAWFNLIAIRPMPLDNKFVYRVADAILDYLRSNVDDLPHKDGLVDIIETNDTSVMGEPIDIVIGLDFVPGPDEYPIGQGLMEDYGSDGTSKYVRIVIKTNPKFHDWPGLLNHFEDSFEFRKSIAQVISHELTHAKDFIKPGPPGQPNDTRGQSKSDYYNNVAESKAFMRNVSQDVLDFFKNKAFVDPIDSSEDQKIAFEEGLKNSHYWGKIEGYLFPETRRKILTGVYTFLRDHGYFGGGQPE